MSGMKTREEQISGRCVHFNGLMRNVCEADIRYDEVRGSGVGLERFPCFKGGPDSCSMRQFPTPEEVREQIERHDAAIKAFVEKLESNICPHCDAPVQRQVQVGRCVYAEPCGHRLYQGRVRS